MKSLETRDYMLYGLLAFLLGAGVTALSVIPYFAEYKKTPLKVTIAWLVLFLLGMFGVIITQIVFNVVLATGNFADDHVAWARDSLSVYFTPFFFVSLAVSIVFALAACLDHKMAFMRVLGSAIASFLILILTWIYALLAASEGVNVSAFIHSFGLFFAMLPSARGVIDNYRLWREFEKISAEREMKKRRAKERKEYLKNRKY